MRGSTRNLSFGCANRVTTLKERFVGRSGSGVPSQMLRVDTETSEAISDDLEEQLIEGIRQRVLEHDVVLISDYAKGVCTPRCIRETIRVARRAERPVLVDPGRDRDFRLYSGATLVKPNRHETEAATQRLHLDPEDAIQAGADCSASNFRWTWPSLRSMPVAWPWSGATVPGDSSPLRPVRFTTSPEPVTWSWRCWPSVSERN